MKILTVFLLLICSKPIFGQNVYPIKKFSIGADAMLGYSKAEHKVDQVKFKESFDVAKIFSICFQNRIKERWLCNLGIGITNYSIKDKSPDLFFVRRYYFNMPHVSAGIQYLADKDKKVKKFIKVTGGLHLWRHHLLVYTDFPEYKFQDNPSRLYFLRPEIGIRSKLPGKKEDTQRKWEYELGAFFSHCFDQLAPVELAHQNNVTVVHPQGNIAGVYFRCLIGFGKDQEKNTGIPLNLSNYRY